MAKITLPRAKLVELFEYCVDHDLKEFFVAKDQGAYIGANHGKGESFTSCIIYFPGCDPKKDPDWYDTCHDKFGGDDFGERLPLAWLKMVADDTSIASALLIINKSSIKWEVAPKAK